MEAEQRVAARTADHGFETQQVAGTQVDRQGNGLYRIVERVITGAGVDRHRVQRADDDIVSGTGFYAFEIADETGVVRGTGIEIEGHTDLVRRQVETIVAAAAIDRGRAAPLEGETVRADSADEMFEAAEAGAVDAAAAGRINLPGIVTVVAGERIVDAAADEMFDAAEADIAGIARAIAAQQPAVGERAGQFQGIAVAGVDVVEADRNDKGVALIHEQTIGAGAAGDTDCGSIRECLAGDDPRRGVGDVVVDDDYGIDAVDFIEPKGQVIAAGVRGKGQIGGKQ